MAEGLHPAWTKKLIRIKTLDGFCCLRYFGESEAVLQRTLAGGEAPSGSADPATLGGNFFVAIEPRDLLPASFGKPFCHRPFGCLFPVSAPRKHPPTHNPPRQI